MFTEKIFTKSKNSEPPVRSRLQRLLKQYLACLFYNDLARYPHLEALGKLICLVPLHQTVTRLLFHIQRSPNCSVKMLISLSMITYPICLIHDLFTFLFTVLFTFLFVFIFRSLCLFWKTTSKVCLWDYSEQELLQTFIFVVWNFEKVSPEFVPSASDGLNGLYTVWTKKVLKIYGELYG